ncbi:phosphoribosyltransferase [Glaciibacter superstes]|uniref:phosphoribosyltransferase n=1 Tax=Glaciibacter superstes TaxID=501023 RepID=UPI0003B71271|nr:phosphoribosyltransferase [Glaciibacter superstes]
MFRDRSEAGRLLATELTRRLPDDKLHDPIVYALPRGGVPVAIEVARMLRAPLDLLIVRKIGAPGYPEVALGAVVDGDDPQTIINDDVYAATGRDAEALERIRRRELAEIERRRSRYLGDRAPLDPSGRTAIVVDDGLATGATAKAALTAVRRMGASRTVLAVPVAPDDTERELNGYADQVIALEMPTEFWAIGQFYTDFHQLTDDETIGMLRQMWSGDGES